MDPYQAWLREVLQLAGEIYFRRVEAELWKFAEALDQWLHELFTHPRPDWRASFDQLLAQQEAEGRLIEPKSRQELLDFLEGWAAGVDWNTAASQTASGEGEVVVLAAPERTWQSAGQEWFVGGPPRDRGRTLSGGHGPFLSRRRAAKGHLVEMQRVLEALGQELDAAEVGEEVEVESAVDAIEALIWQYNDALEKARDLWLRYDLGGDTYNQLASISTPVALGLPRFVDEQQAVRADAQAIRITKRLNRRVERFDQIISAMEVTEAAGALASWAVGGRVVYQAVRTGGKWAVVKTLAQVAAAGTAAYGTGKAVEHGLRAAGASEETIHGVRLAAEVVTWLLLLRRIRSSGAKLTTSKRPKTGGRNAKVPDASSKSRTEVPKPGAKEKALEVSNEGSPDRRSVSDRKRSQQRPSTYLRGRYSGSASEPGAYWASDRRVFPTRRNSGLSGQKLRAEQENFFIRGLRDGKSPGMLRGQAAAAGYERRGGINNVGGPDRLADKGAEQALQRAMMEISKANPK